MHQRGEITIAGADNEGGDVVPLESHLQGVDGHLDVCRVLADGPHPLRDLDQFDVVLGEHPSIVVEHRPVGVGLAGDHPPPLRQRVCDRFEVELAAPHRLPGADGEVFVVEEEGNAFVVWYHPTEGTDSADWNGGVGRDQTGVAGPGAITTAIVLSNDAATVTDQLLLFGMIGLVLGLTLLAFLGVERLNRWIGLDGQRITMRLVGLIEMAFAVEFLFEGLTPIIRRIIA